MAEQYPTNGPDKIPTNGSSSERIVTREGAEGGAEIYSEPRRRGFPWWILLLGLIPLLIFAMNRGNDRDRAATTAASPVAVATPAAVTTSPSPYAAGSGGDDLAAGAGAGAAAAGAAGAMSNGTDTTSESGSAALPPDGKDIKVYGGNDIAAAPKNAASEKGEPLSDVVMISQVADKSTLVDRKAKLTNVNVVEVLSPRALIVGPSAGQHMLVLLDRRLDAGTQGQKVSVAAGKPVSLIGIIKESPSADVVASEYGVAADKMTAHTDDTIYLHATVAQEK